MSEVLAIGVWPFTTADAQGLRDTFPGVRIAETFDDVAAMPEAERAAIRAVAYKGMAPFGGDRMDLLPKLGLIANYGVGYDAIDVGAADARGIKVTNTPDVLSDDVADLAVGMMLALSRRLIDGDDWVRSGKWAKGGMPLNRKMSGAPVGILGLGRIGQEIADRLAAFKMPVHYWSRSEKETPGWTYHADPVSLAKAVDWLVVATVGGAATEGIVSAEVIEALGPEGVVVNISRGSTVDEEALLSALEDGRLGGAALDVFRSEPDPDPRFAKLENVVLQPHQGSATHATRAAMAKLQRDNVAAFLRGEALLTPVN